MRKRGLWSIGIAVLAVFVMAACGNGTTGSSGAIDGLLREYMALKPQRWDDGTPFNAYFLDPARFEAFKAELDKTGEYSQVGSEEIIRDWDLGLNYAEWYVLFDPAPYDFDLRHTKEDNSVVIYHYEKVPQTSGTKTEGLLRKYMGPQPQIWDEGVAYVYFLDPARFEAFKAELEALGEYVQTTGWTEENRDYDRGVTFARWAVRADGGFQLDLFKEDNSIVKNMYEKVTQ